MLIIERKNGDTRALAGDEEKPLLFDLPEPTDPPTPLTAPPSPMTR
jgi:hypothetical protein